LVVRACRLLIQAAGPLLLEFFQIGLNCSTE
jgi:hypothetical protein